jgi:hypothetical protein
MHPHHHPPSFPPPFQPLHKTTVCNNLAILSLLVTVLKYTLFVIL